QLDIFADQPRQHLLHVPDHQIQVEDLWLKHLLATEGQKLTGERRCSFCGLVNLADVILQRIVFLELRSNELCISDYRSEQVVEVVCNSTGEPSYRLHLLRLSKLVFTLSLPQKQADVLDGYCSQICGHPHRGLMTLIKGVRLIALYFERTNDATHHRHRCNQRRARLARINVESDRHKGAVGHRNLKIIQNEDLILQKLHCVRVRTGDLY